MRKNLLVSVIFLGLTACGNVTKNMSHPHTTKNEGFTFVRKSTQSTIRILPDEDGLYTATFEWLTSKGQKQRLLADGLSCTKKINHVNILKSLTCSADRRLVDGTYDEIKLDLDDYGYIATQLTKFPRSREEKIEILETNMDLLP